MMIKVLLLAALMMGSIVDSEEILMEEWVIVKSQPDKPFRIPRVTSLSNRSQRVGAHRMGTLLRHCDHGETCLGCNCCGTCTNNTFFLCYSPLNSIDYCAFDEEVLKRDPNAVLPRRTASFKLPDDFPREQARSFF